MADPNFYQQSLNLTKLNAQTLRLGVFSLRWEVAICLQTCGQ